MIRCSSISKIMTDPRSKSEEWSATSISAMMEIVRESIFGVRKDLDDVKTIQKGRMLEQAGIDLYNDVFLQNLIKVDSSARRSNGVITGEPDLIAATMGKGVDIKVAWSLLTFPLNEEMAGKKSYEWQARGYMCLFDLPRWEIAYCMIDTPDDLLKPWDNPDHHRVDAAVPLHHRITVATFERDAEIERAMLERCKRANDWIDAATRRFAIDHDKYIE
jgi:hypothetical protein